MKHRAHRIWLLIVFAMISFMIFSQIGAEPELKDTPYFSGMPNYRIVEGLDQEFADYRFFNGKDCTAVEGAKYFRVYTLKENAKPSSELQVSRNYSNAIQGMGGTVVFEGEISGVECAENSGGRVMIGKVVKQDSELWLEVAPFNAGNDYYLIVVAKEAMKQVVTAGDMLEALNKDGRFVLNINFDPGLAILKPEYNPVIAQIVELLKTNPGIRLSIEGHTDGTGTLQETLPLSEERAKTVMNAITAQGIDSKRLRAKGFGSDKPIADAATDAGKAKNRRVEFVKF